MVFYSSLAQDVLQPTHKLTHTHTFTGQYLAQRNLLGWTNIFISVWTKGWKLVYYWFEENNQMGLIYSGTELEIFHCVSNPVSPARLHIHLLWHMRHVSISQDRDLGWCVSHWPCSKALSGQGGDGKKEKTSKDKLPASGMWLLPITAGICGVTYQANGKYLTFNFLAVR